MFIHFVNRGLDNTAQSNFNMTRSIKTQYCLQHSNEKKHGIKNIQLFKHDKTINSTKKYSIDGIEIFKDCKSINCTDIKN